MTPRHSYYWFWHGLLRDVGGSRIDLYGLFVASLLVCAVLFGEAKALAVSKKHTLAIVDPEYAQGYIEGAKRNRFTPFQIEAGKVRDYLVERMEERLAQAERGF